MDYRDATNDVTNQKGYTEFVPRLLHRRLSIPLAKALVRRFPNIDPNGITMLAAAVGIGAALCFLFGSIALAGLLLQVSFFIDCLDGDVARALPAGKRSRAMQAWGMFLDTLLDRIVDAFVLLCIGWRLQHDGDASWVEALVGGTLATTLIATYSRHAVRSAFAAADYEGVYQGSVLDSAGRGARLLILTFGATGELFLHGSLIGGIAFLFFCNTAQLIARTMELRRNLRRAATKPP